MNRAAIIEDIEATIAADLPEVDVVDVEVAGGHEGSVIRVFIDHPEGVSLELCARVTSLLAGYLQDHTVEVSSPGIEKRLRKPGHFQAAVGQKINVKTFGPVEGSRNFTGFLFSVNDDSLTLELEGGEHMTFPLDQVAMARTVFEFGDERRPSGKRRRKRGK